MKGCVKMKKLLSGTILMLAALGLLLFIIKKCYMRTATLIIGDSNGATSYFAAGKYNDFTPIFFIIGVPIIIVFFLLRNKK